MDKNTNLQEVPEGFYWEVKYDGMGLYSLRLRKSNRFWFDGTLIRTSIHEAHMSVYKLQQLSESLYDRWTTDLGLGQQAEKFIGKYPPKKLGEWND